MYKMQDNCYIDIGAIVTGGVRIAANKYVPIGAIINTQAKADNLSEVPKERSDFAGIVNNLKTLTLAIWVRVFLRIILLQNYL